MAERCEKCNTCTSWCSSRVQRKISTIFAWVGYNAFIYPCRCILLGIIITIICGIGLINIEFESDGVRLWIPDDSEIMEHYDEVIDFFGEFETFVAWLVANENDDTNNLLTKQNLDGLYNLFDYVFNDLTADEANKIWYYKDFCLRDYPSYPICDAKESNIFSLWNNSINNWQTKQDIKQGMKTDYGQSLGALLLADFVYDNTSNENIIGGEYLRIKLDLQSTTNDTIYDAISEFMLEFEEFMKDDYVASDFGITSNISITYRTAHSLSNEISRVVTEDLPIYIATFLVMIIYLSINLGTFSCIGARCWLAVITIITMIMALITGYGLGSGISVEMNTIVLLIPYILIGVGVDDEILIIEAIDRLGYENIDTNDPFTIGGAKRFSKALKHCGLSISLTSFCSVIAFAVGTNVSMPGVRNFCIFAAFCFAANYILQFLIFLPILALDEKRKLAKRNFCCPCIKHDNTNDDNVSNSSSNNNSGNRRGDVASNSTKNQEVHKGEEELTAMRGRGRAGSGDSMEDNNTDVSETVAQGGVKQTRTPNNHTTPAAEEKTEDEDISCLCIIRNLNVLGLINYIIIPLLNKRINRFLISLLFIILFVLSIISLQWLDVESDESRLVPDDSFVIDYLDSYEDAFGQSYIRTIDIVLKNLDFSDIIVRENVYSLIEEIESFDKEYDNGDERSYALSEVEEWLTDFETFIIDNNNNNITINDLNNTEFYQQLQVFANTTEYIEWANEILYDNNNNPTKIKGTRFYVQFLVPKVLGNQWAVRNDLYDIIKDNVGNNNGYPFHSVWPFAYFEDSIVELTIRNIGSASGGVFIVLCIMMDIKMAIFIVIVVIMIDVELFGWMVLCDASLDSITFLQLVMAVGLTVDYVIHITHALVDSKPSNIDSEENPNEYYGEKVKITMIEMGVGVVKGAWTTFLGVFSLAFSSSVAFRGFFLLFAGIILVALANGLLFVPSIMSEMKCLYNSENNKNEHENENDAESRSSHQPDIQRKRSNVDHRAQGTPAPDRSGKLDENNDSDNDNENGHLTDSIAIIESSKKSQKFVFSKDDDSDNNE